jgi:hypothetical protein
MLKIAVSAKLTDLQRIICFVGIAAFAIPLAAMNLYYGMPEEAGFIDWFNEAGLVLLFAILVWFMSSLLKLENPHTPLAEHEAPPVTQEAREVPLAFQHAPTIAEPSLAEKWFVEHYISRLGKADSPYKNETLAVPLIEFVFAKKGALGAAAAEAAEAPTAENLDAFSRAVGDVFLSHGYLYERLLAASEFDLRLFAKIYNEHADLEEAAIFNAYTG